MKKFLAKALGAAVVAGMLVAPATAGVQGTGGGTNTSTTTRTEVHTQRTTSTSTSYLAPIIRDLGNKVVSYSNTSTTNRIVQWASDWRTSYYLANGCGYPVEGSEYTTSSSTSWLSFLRNAEREVADVLISSTYTKTGETLDHTTGQKTVADSANLIIIGDQDAGGYAAQGTRNTTLTITDYIWDNLHRADTRQKTLERWKEYQQNTHTTYTTVESWYAVTPIVLNMDGSGKLGASNGKWMPHEKTMYGPLAVFDFFGSGEPVLMEWVGPNDGLLCRAGNGKFDGTCLFGSANGYDNGFEELSSLDKNGDRRLTGKELEGLFVWQDKNANAIPGKAEVQTVQELGITQINLDYHQMTGSFVMNGQQLKMWDWNPIVKKLKQSAGM